MNKKAFVFVILNSNKYIRVILLLLLVVVDSKWSKSDLFLKKNANFDDFFVQLTNAQQLINHTSYIFVRLSVCYSFTFKNSFFNLIGSIDELHWLSSINYIAISYHNSIECDVVEIY